MNIELIRKILSAQRVRYAEPDNFVFDFGVSIRAIDCDSVDPFIAVLTRLCDHPEFTTEHLRELLEYLGPWPIEKKTPQTV